MEPTGSESYIGAESDYYWEVVEGYVIANDNNPVDSVGYIHNVLAGEVEAAGSPEDNIDEVLNTSDSVWEAHYGETNFNHSIYKDYVEIIKHQKVDYFLDTLLADTITKNRFEELIAIVSEYDATNFGLIYQNIVSFEDSLMNKYSQGEIKPILLGSSIARYSFAYWHERLSGEMKSQVRNMKLPPYAWYIGGADLVGGVAEYLGSDDDTSTTEKILNGLKGALETSLSAATLWQVYSGIDSKN